MATRNTANIVKIMKAADMESSVIKTAEARKGQTSRDDLAEKVVRVVGTDRRGPTGTHRYAIINPGDAPPLRRGDSSLGRRQQALWTAMRSLRQFRASSLAEAASTDTVMIARETASGYIADLLRVGYLAVVGRAPERSQTLVYRLVRDSGPRAPIVMRAEAACFDLNLMKVINLNAPVTAGRAA